MVVVTDVKNMDGMLLIPAGCTLSERQINILQAWGVEEIEVQASSASHDADPLAKLSPDVIEKIKAEIRSLFWDSDDSNPFFAELCRILLERRARNPKPVKP